MSEQNGLVDSDFVSAVENKVSMCSGAWDMVDPREIISAVLETYRERDTRRSALDAEVVRVLREADTEFREIVAWMEDENAPLRAIELSAIDGKRREISELLKKLGGGE